MFQRCILSVPPVKYSTLSPPDIRVLGDVLSGENVIGRSFHRSQRLQEEATYQQQNVPHLTF